MAITGNKGEWSEIYTLFKILSEKSLFPGDHKLEKIENLIYPIIKVLRTETSGIYEYSIKDDLVFVTSEGKELVRLPVQIFQEQASLLLDKIKVENSVFSLPDTEDFMSSINCESLKAGSSNKTDITIVIHDEKTGQKPELGFSIKSQLGSPSTLLNAGKTTNFKYRINGKLSDSQIEIINNLNSKSKIKERVEAILKAGCSIEFEKIPNEVFSNNMILIDSSLPLILSNMVLMFYSTSNTKTSDLLNSIQELNPLKFDTSNDHPFYSYKLKRLYTDIAVGMMPSIVWTGSYDATGGYLIVKDDGDVLCYHLFNRNEFENYLIKNTKFETASSSRHDFGSIYKEDGSFYMNLNLQIRFIK